MKVKNSSHRLWRKQNLIFMLC